VVCAIRAVSFRVTAAAKTVEEARALLTPTLAEVRAAIGEEYIRSVEED